MKWRPGRTRSGSDDSTVSGRSISQRKQFKSSPGKTAAFFAVFLLVGLGFMLIFALPAWKVVKARGWTAVDCEILSSSVGSHSSDDGGSTYSVDVTYHYVIDGAEYVGDRYQFLGGSSSGYEGKKKVVDALPDGGTTTCYVDPDDPSEAVLDRGLSWVYLFALLPLVFIVVGGVGVAWALYSGRLRKRAAASFEGARGDRQSDPWGGSGRGDERAGWSSGGFREAEPGSAALPVWISGTSVVPEVGSGPVELEEPMSPAGKLGCLVGVALFWNGIVSVFVWQLWSSWRAGGGLDGCLALFLVPFVLVGLALLVGIPYQFLALANPRPRLVLSRGGIPLGGEAQLDWTFRGSTARLQNLRIWVVGSEKATHRSGTTTHTDTEVFAEIEVVGIDDHRPLAAGRATLAIPADTMHSFDAPRNQISWTIRLSASIAWWPDVNAEFPFVVEPGGDRA